jgi:colicin import membrane protein
MPSHADRLEFQPPPSPGMGKAFGIAIFAHILLMLALTWGVSWNKDVQDAAVEAELWSSVPQQAAPKPVEVTPPPPPKVEPRPDPKPAAREADIAVEREKKKELEKKKLEDQREEEKKAADLKKKQDADLKKKQEADNKRRNEEEAKAAEKQRQDNLRRIAGMAGATGGPEATGTAQRSSGPSDSYGGRIRARVKPNIVFTDDVSGNPVAEVEVRASPDGTIVGTRLIKSSGLKSWDDAVIKAVIKTEVLPRDIDGRVPSPIVIAFRPKD